MPEEAKTVSIGCDHAGFPYKEAALNILKEKGFNVIDHGTHSDASTDYPDHVHPVGEDIDCGRAQFGIIMCGSGNGSAMAANKHPGVRAALCWTRRIAELAREHNDANVLSVPVRFIDEKTAGDIISAFLEAQFEGGRHERRVDKIPIKSTYNC